MGRKQNQKQPFQPLTHIKGVSFCHYAACKCEEEKTEKTLMSGFPATSCGIPMAEPEMKRSKIMVAVNESEESMHSLSWCLQNFIPCRKARNSEITLVLLYVMPAPPPPDHTGLFWSKIGAMLEEYGKETARTVMERAKEMCKSYEDLDHIKIESIVESGDARDVICEMVEKVGADILIMGGHPLTATKSNSASVSEHCAQKVKCPIFIVKQPGRHSKNHTQRS